MRVGIIGYGLAGRVFHGRLLAASNDADVVAVVTRDPGRAAEARSDFPRAACFDTVEELLAGTALDLAVVATATPDHLASTLACLKARVATVVDKPFAPSAAQARQILDAAGDTPLTVFQNRRWDSDFRTAKHLIADGRLGTVHRYESRFERWRPQVATGWRESADPAKAGGVLNDLGSHLVDQALHLFGPAAHVYAEVNTVRPGAAVDDDAFIALTHTSGVHSHLWMSAVTAQPGPRLRILGNQNAYTVQGLDPQEAALRAGERPGPGWGEPAESEWGLLGTTEEAHRYPSLPGDYPAFYAGVVAALRDGGRAPVDPRDALAALDVLELARRSAAERKAL